MFATLLGGLPRPPRGPAARGNDRSTAGIEAGIARVIDAQDAAGLEPLTDGRLRWPGYAGPLAGLRGVGPGRRRGDLVLAEAAVPEWPGPLAVEAWRFAAGLTGRAVKQALPGPYSLARRLVGARGAADRARVTLELAIAIRSEVIALAEAGCPLVEIEERDANKIGEDPSERRLFREAHRALTGGVRGVHLSLALIGGNADAAGAETILAAPYSSLAVDLIAGPDNWRLVRAVPGDRGIVAGAMSPRHPTDDGPELLVWAAAYAAASNDRGRDRVGLAIAGSLATSSWAVAERKLRRLGEAARLAALPATEAAPYLDPRAADIRSAALGRYAPRPARRR